MGDIIWPKLLCPHCGNREEFRFEVSCSIYVGKTQIGRETPEIEGLPFNSRVWCVGCGEQGRWNAWMRGAYTDERMEPGHPDCPHDEPFHDHGDGCPACSLAEESPCEKCGHTLIDHERMGWTCACNDCPWKVGRGDVEEEPFDPEVTPTCYACFLEAEERRTGWAKLVYVDHGLDPDGHRCQCRKMKPYTDWTP